VSSLALGARRRQASAASGGSSDEAIYAMFVRAVRRLGLSGDLLDAGAGQARLTARLAALGRFATITAIDLAAPPAEIDHSIRWLQADLNDGIDLPAQSFDVIVAAELIEHLENPRAVAREWFQLLRPGGTLLCSTPNNESWRALGALVLRGHFVAFSDRCYPAHITALVRRDLSRILDEAGFTAPDFAFTDEGAIPRLARLRWQSVSRGRLRGLRYSDNLLAVARRP
jgi:2-polyprenyl-3-methyl-5-hydroxy-6-metoxy-1,4-benzoquinol methylase